MWTSVNGSNGPLRTRSKTMRDAAQHVAAQELAVDVDELRVRTDRAGAGHAVRLQESPGQGSWKTYSGTRQPSATAKKGPVFAATPTLGNSCGASGSGSAGRASSHRSRDRPSAKPSTPPAAGMQSLAI